MTALLRDNSRRLGAAALVVALIAPLVVLAVRADGNLVPDLDLHDAGVWVVNEASAAIGRTNTEIDVVDTRLDAGTNSFELFQAGAAILVHRLTAPAGLIGVDPAIGEVIRGPELSADAQVAMGGGTAAAFDPSSGRLVVVSAESSAAAVGLDPVNGAEPTTHIDGPGALAVGTDGLAHLLDVDGGTITSWTSDGARRDSRAVAVDDDASEFVLSAVGDLPVVLTDSNRLLVPGAAPRDLSDLGDGLVLQEPGDDRDAVLVASDGGLFLVPLDGGPVATLFETDSAGAARPVFVAGCSYGAWSADVSWAQDCAGVTNDGTEPRMTPGGTLRWRVNRNRLTLNNVLDGSQLLFTADDPTFIDGEWQEALVLAADDDTEKEEDDEEADRSEEPECVDPESNEQPIAEPDEFGTREGRPVVVHPLRNDFDANCDTLLIESVEPARSEAGRVDVVDDGRAVQVRLEPGVESMTFAYVVTDGRGGRASSTVAMSVVPDTSNQLPVVENGETTVVTGGTVTHDVLATAFDPDGDTLTLVSASSQQAADLRFNARGEITFTASNVPGVADVIFTVTDNRGEGQSGSLRVEVVDRSANQPPTVRNESVAAFVGRKVVVDVLANDDDPDGDPLRVVSVDADTDATPEWDSRSSVVRLTSSRPGTVNVTYKVTDGREQDDAVLRIDFREPIDQTAPVAVRDDVRLAPGAPVFLPVLDNDVDPNGEVLVLLSVDGLPDPSPISVTALRRSFLQISAATPLTEPVEFSYRISDGRNVDDGLVVVQPIEPVERNRPPVVRTDEYRVHAGGIAVLDVLANDSDPEGDAIEIVPPLEEQPDADTKGRLFLTGGTLRYEAPPAPTTATLKYDVLDSASNPGSAEIHIEVIPADDSSNRPPNPPELVGRTVAGESVTIKVPVTTMDPDGDAVRLLRVDGSTQHGAITEIRGDELVYQSDDTAAGTDEFSYTVVDAYGAEATGTVLVGVAQPPTANSDPIPLDDEFIVEPGTTAVIDVLANDEDPDPGDELSISTDPLEVPTLAARSGTVEVIDDPDVGSAVRFTAPMEPPSEMVSFLYVALDGRGGSRAARVTVVFGTEEENNPPLAEDDVEAEPQYEGAVVRIPVLANDDDPDGDELSVVGTSFDGARIVDGDDGTDEIEFVMPDRHAQFTYAVTDGEDTVRAAVFVPWRPGGRDADEDLPPIARTDTAEVDSGQSVVIDVMANDEDPEGARLHLMPLLAARHGSIARRGDDIVFTAEDGYVGDAGFSYEIADGPDPATAQTAVGSVQIRVNGNVNAAPSFTQLSVRVPAGGERTIDLASGVEDPDRDDEHTFGSPSVDGSGIDASRSGGTLVVRAHRDAQPGQTATVTFEVSDGEAVTTGTVVVEVTSSERPEATAVADQAETIQGRAVDIDVLANDVNPYPDEPLRIVTWSAPPPNAGTVTAQGARLRFTPTADHFGVVTFTYTVGDATMDPAREVSGTVTVTVIGRPDRPAAPTCIGGESRVVRVQWAAPAANGAPITEYRIRINSAGGRDERTFPGSGTIQDIDGLTNGTAYTFEVAAVNRAVTGEPEFSEPSPSCTPDQVPGVPAPPVTEFGDKSLDITWTEPSNEGSPITGYILTNTTNGESRTFGPSTFQTTWDGLTNGTSYRFTLVAENARGQSQPSPLSTGDDIPAGRPLTPTAPRVQQTVGQRDGFLDVHWEWNDSAQSNGDAIKAFRITVFRNGSQSDEVVINDAAARTERFLTDNGVPYRFTVAAENKAGWSDPSSQSAEAVSAAPPDAVSSVSATEGDRETTLSFAAPEDNGAAISGYEYSRNGGSWQPLSTSGTGSLTARVTGLTNGTNYTFKVRARNEDGTAPDGPSSNQINPYGTPTTPSVSSSASGRTINWNWSASDGNGRTIVRYEIRLDGGGWQDNGTSRSYSRDFGYAETHSLSVRAVSNASDPARRTSGAGSSSSRTVDPPQPQVTVVRGGNAQGRAGCTSADCSYLRVSWDNLPAGQHTYRCYEADGTDFGVQATISGTSGSNHEYCYADASVWGGVYVVIDGRYRSNTASW